jgi:hypothetical protein
MNLLLNLEFGSYVLFLNLWMLLFKTSYFLFYFLEN